jgi:hypothetical protein
MNQVCAGLNECVDLNEDKNYDYSYFQETNLSSLNVNY